MSLTLFTNITEQLTDLEREKLVPLLLNALDTLPYGQRLTSKSLCHYLRGLNYQVSDVRIRKMVNYIRVTNAAKPKVLIGASDGYYLTADIQVVDDQIESMEGRIDSMKSAIDAMKAQRLNLLRP